MMNSRVARIAKRTALILAIVLLTVLALRAWDSQRRPPLEPWHTYAPHELSVEEIDKTDWSGYLKAEAAIFDEVRREVTDKLPEHDRVPSNRYFAASPVYPGRFAHDWNRSYVLVPEGPPQGAVVLLHGLTDSPYSLRHIARRYVAHGYAAVAIRLPGHGTVPAGLADIEWEKWAAATRLAVREAHRLAPSKPLHVVGFSMGGALAVMYALDALGDPSLPKADRIVLLSPMIGITSFARFVGFAALPAMLPPFAKAAWLSIDPEFNPFKYNSFPVNGGRQAHRLTVALQARINRYASEGRLSELPPILTFQSVIDFTVTTRAIISALYAHLPANGSELVLFDVNQAAHFSPLLRSNMETAVNRMLPAPPRSFRTTVISNAAPDVAEVVERVTEAGETTEHTRPLGLSYPPDIYSLSHVALPFPPSDPLYGLQPDSSEDFGINLGAMAGRGERGVLIVSLDSLLRVSSNPFYSYMIQRIEENIGVGQRSAVSAR